MNIFPKWMNALPTLAAVGAVFGLTAVSLGYWYYLWPAYWRVGYEPVQPVYYSHQTHAGKLGMDCRYCHTQVEESPHANIPDTTTCMNCHTGVGEQAYLNVNLWKSHKDLAPLVTLRAAYAEGEAIQWRRIHKAPDYVNFNHAAHLKAGVSCYSCHGRIDEFAVVRQVHGMGMGFCLECHRNPDGSLIAADDRITTPEPKITDLAAVEQIINARLQDKSRTDGNQLAEIRKIHAPQSCSTCHY